MKKIIINNIWWVTFLLAICLLTLHSFKIASIEVDSTSIILLIVALLSPFITSIKKIKYGEFEAEIDPKEVEKIKTDIENNSTAKSTEEEFESEVDETSNAIRELAKSDPIIALAKIRIELEKVLNRIARSTEIDVHRLSLGSIVKALSNHEIISAQTGKSLSQVINICNRAIHGETISEESAETIVELGIKLLEEITWDLELQLMSGVVKSEVVITPEEMHSYYEEKKYKLTTIIPLVENPKRVVRELSQEQLYNFLDGYTEFAEFIVELVEIKK
ncbi:DUF4145 domain-containing protein [Shewanella sp. SM55]|uniref:DUF4145 domain-containing protein n=1 Tax=Shewanella sp. SM55 TaxID=2912800 RepID=UPI0021D927B5|nr:DUF4145 domain-containing protein [Shewanella sp. SM55]MCU8061702.1 DUF4145 domain-containing protein [Shewanella sp. SM55]